MPSRKRLRRIFLYSSLCLCVSVVGNAGCGRKESDKTSAGGPGAQSAYVPPPPIKPEYTFAEGLREKHPAPAMFVQQFLETCLAGDYAGYRLLASRRREPESRERFTTIYHGIRGLHVESIEQHSLPELAEEVYLVVCKVDFPPDSKVKLRRKTDKVAILAFKEEGEWRMLPAPAAMQPGSETMSESDRAPATTSAPTYPWDEEGP